VDPSFKLDFDAMTGEYLKKSWQSAMPSADEQILANSKSHGKTETLPRDFEFCSKCCGSLVTKVYAIVD
jgi:hypothetical protein